MGEVCLELLGGPALVDGEALSHTPGTQLYIKRTRAIFDAGIYLDRGSRDSCSRRFCFKFVINSSSWPRFFPLNVKWNAGCLVVMPSSTFYTHHPSFLFVLIIASWG